MSIGFHITALIVGAILITSFAFIAAGGRDWHKHDYKELGGFIFWLTVYFELTFWIAYFVIKLL